MPKSHISTNSLLIVAASLLLLSVGCKERQGDVRTVRPGTPASKIVGSVGKPDYKISGQGVHTGWEEWVYPSGSIIFYRLVVKHVLPREKGQPQPQPRIRRQDQMFQTEDTSSEKTTISEIDQIIAREKARRAESGK